jgi:hypothetical protein
MKLAIGLLAASLSFAQAPAAISGKVVNAQTNEALTGVTVSLGYGADAEKVTTDENGAFRLKVTKPGPQHLMAEKSGFVRTSPGASGMMRLGTPIPVAAGQQVGGILLRMMPEAVISGRVVNEAGTLVPASVTVSGAAMPGSMAGFASLTNGVFRVGGLPAGSYVVSAQGPRDQPFPLTYFPSELDPARGERITLGDAEQKSGIVIVMKETRYFTVSGRYTGELTSEQRDEATIQYDRVDRRPQGIQPTGRLDGEQRFTVKLPAGEYRLKLLFFPRPAPGVRRQPLNLGFITVSVTDRDLENVVMPPSPIYTVRARFRWANAANLTPPTGGITLNPTEGLGVMQVGQKQADGSVSVPNISPDRYAVLIGVEPKDAYVKAVLSGGHDISTGGLDLLNSAVPELDIVVDDSAGVVSGQVTDAAGKSVPGASIWLHWAGSTQMESQLRSRGGSSVADGSFILTGLAPGEYTILGRSEGMVSPIQRIRVEPRRELRVPLVLSSPQ